MVDLVTVDVVSSVVASAGSISPAMLAELITAVSAIAQRFCGRQFVPNRWVERYDPASVGYLMLRQTPVLALNGVTLYPESPNPVFCTPDQFDLRAGIGRIAFLPQTATGFPVFWGTGAMDAYGYTGFPGLRRSSIQVDYTAGFGFLITSPTAIAAGLQTLTPSAMSGITGEGVDFAPWQLAAGNSLIVDPGFAVQETVTVTAVSGGSFTAVFTQPHAAGAQLAGPLLPADLQFAVALMVGNLINQTDLTKSRESLGRTVGYEYFVRAGDLIMTPEIRAILGRYRDVVL